MTSANEEAELRLKYIHELASTVTNSQADPRPGKEQLFLKDPEAELLQKQPGEALGRKRKVTVYSIIVRGVYLFQVWQFRCNVFLF